MTDRLSRWTGGSYTQVHYIVKMLGESKTGSYRQVVAKAGLTVYILH